LLAAAMSLFPGGGELASLLAPLAGLPLLWGFTAIHEASLLRDNKGSRTAAVLVFAETSAFLTLLAALSLGFGVASLVASRLVNAAATLAGYLIASNERLRIEIDRAKAKAMLHFSANVWASRLIGWVDGYGGDILIASLLSASGLGIYRMGNRLFMAGAGVLLAAPGTTQIATTGKAAERGSARTAVVTARFVELHAALALPVFAGLAASAPFVIDLFLKPEWSAAAGITMIACLSAPGWILANANAAVLLARDQSRPLLHLNAVASLAGNIAILLGTLGGPIGVAAAKVIASTGFAIAGAIYFNIVGKTRTVQTCWRLLAIGVACLALALTVWSSLSFFSGMHKNALLSLIELAIAGTLGLLAYGAVLRLTSPQSFRLVHFTLLRLLLPGQREKRSPPLLHSTDGSARVP
jgi:O-antigen/teichoic acid export membrane protein